MKTQQRPRPADPDLDQDNAWKDLLDLHFREFMEFFFPRIAAEINWARKPCSSTKNLPNLAHVT